MCDVKKLCTCEEVKPGQDHWKLEFLYGQYPSWGTVIRTRPEHKKKAQVAMEQGKHVMGPLPIPQFDMLHQGLADRSQMEKVIEAEDRWLNEGNPFDFDYEPFDGDRLMYIIGGEEIAFSFKDGKWRHQPHQAYSVDSRRMVDEVKEDREARSKAAEYLELEESRNETEVIIIDMFYRSTSVDNDVWFFTDRERYLNRFDEAVKKTPIESERESIVAKIWDRQIIEIDKRFYQIRLKPESEKSDKALLLFRETT